MISASGLQGVLPRLFSLIFELTFKQRKRIFLNVAKLISAVNFILFKKLVHIGVDYTGKLTKQRQTSFIQDWMYENFHISKLWEKEA